MSWKDEVREKLKGLNLQGVSWSVMEERYSTNRGYLWHIAQGNREPKPALARKLGINVQGQHVVPFHCETAEQAQQLREIFGQFGSRVDLRDKLLDGRVQIYEVVEYHPSFRMWVDQDE